jgi:hypothetical protein
MVASLQSVETDFLSETMPLKWERARPRAQSARALAADIMVWNRRTI